MSLYTNSFTIADLKAAPNASSIQRSNTQRSLHGSQSHANFHFGGGDSGYNNNNMNMNASVGGAGTFNNYGRNDGGGTSVGPGGGGGFGAGGGGGGGQQPQQYMPGYLLSASQGQPAPSQSHSYSLQPLDNEHTIRRSGSAFGRDYGEQSILNATRPSPKGRSPRAGGTDDENAPPTISISESQYILSESAAQRSMPRSTSGGFHPLSISRSTFTPSSSMSTTYESSTPGRPSNAMDEDPPAFLGFSVTVFGFRPDQRQQAINAFMTEQARLKEDDQESEEARRAKNWVEIEYVNQWEAVRAIRKNGIMSLEGGNVRLGAVWTDPSQAPMEGYLNSPNIDMSGQGNGRRSSTSGFTSPAANNPGLTGVGTARSVRVRPSASAFRSATIATSHPVQQQGTQADEWGVGAEAKRLEGQSQPGQAPVQESVLNRVSSMVFGTWAR